MRKDICAGLYSDISYEHVPFMAMCCDLAHRLCATWAVEDSCHVMSAMRQNSEVCRSIVQKKAQRDAPKELMRC